MLGTYCSVLNKSASETQCGTSLISILAQRVVLCTSVATSAFVTEGATDTSTVLSVGNWLPQERNYMQYGGKVRECMNARLSWKLFY